MNDYGGTVMKKDIHLDSGKKVLPIILMAVGAVLALALLFMRLNIVAVVAVAFNCIMSAIITLSLIIKKKFTLRWCWHMRWRVLELCSII